MIQEYYSNKVLIYDTNEGTNNYKEYEIITLKVCPL